MLRVSFPSYSTAHSMDAKRLSGGFDALWKNLSTKAFTKLPQTSFTEKIKQFSQLVIIGLGGSSLGTKAFAQGLNHKNIFFLDNTDPSLLSHLLPLIQKKGTGCFFISKSGETLEVRALARIILPRLKSPQSNCIIITDDPESSLGTIAREHKLTTIISPKNVPGRFSVLSNIARAPLASIGIRMKKTAPHQNVVRAAFNLACAQFISYKKGKKISVFFPYSERLTSLADWYIQLLAESIGKTNKIGITPVKAVGIKDQHAQLQLFLEGPRDKFFILIPPVKVERDFPVPKTGRTLGDIFKAEYLGVKKTFLTKKMDFVEIDVGVLEAATLNELFFLLELSVGFLGELFGVNAFNQPAVEESKKNTKSILKNIAI